MELVQVRFVEHDRVILVLASAKVGIFASLTISDSSTRREASLLRCQPK